MGKEPQSLGELFSQEEFSPISAKLPKEEEEQLAKSIAAVVKKAPADIEKPVVRPKTIQESLTIIQSKAAIYASYDLTATGEDILTFVADQLQDFASSKASLIRPDLFGQLSVELDTDNFPSLSRNKKKLIAEVDKLRKVDFEFSWKSDFGKTNEAKQMFAKPGENIDNFEVETKGTIITTRHDIKNTSRVVLNVNPWCLPFLLYFGKNVGGTKYFKDIALRLPHKYSKRIYKMLMDWHTTGDYHEEKISDFRYCLQIPESYDNNKLKSYILDTARQEILESGSHITFDYELITRDFSGSKTKKATDTIAFHIKGNHVKKDIQATNTKNMCVLLAEIADKGRNRLCDSCAHKIVEDGKYEKIFSKFKYYYNKVSTKAMTKSTYKATLLKIVLEESGFDLRSSEHIRNSERYKRKNGLTSDKKR